MDSFEKQVRKALIDLDMSISDLANQLEISNAYLYDILKSARKAENQKQRIREFLKLSI